MLQVPGHRLAVAGWMSVCWALASAQQAPTIPTPQELEGRKPGLVTDPANVPDLPRPVPRQLARPEADVSIDISRYVVNADAPAELKAALDSLTRAYTGSGKTFADMVDAAAEVTRFLQSELGYYLGYAYIPEQEPADGVIRIEVLEGRLDRVILEWNDGLPVDKAVVSAYLEALRPGTVLKVREVERTVFLLNDLRGITADFEVRAGDAVGTAILVVRPRPQQLTGWRIDVDNTNARTLGRERLTGSISRFSPLGRGDTASASLVVAKGLVFGLASYTSPVGADGLRLGVSASAMGYQVDKQDFPVDIRGTARTASAYMLYPLVRSRNANLFLSGSVDSKGYIDRSGPTSTDKSVYNVNVGLTSDLRDAVGGGGLNSFDLQMVMGEVHFRVVPATDAPDRNFAKLTGRAVRLQSFLGSAIQGLASLRFQKAFNNLDATEQFRAGGPDGVRAFPSGAGSGDNGAMLTAEMRMVVPAAWYSLAGGQAIASVFYDRAVVEARNTPTASSASANRVQFSGSGVGLIWSSPQGWELRTSLAVPAMGKNRVDDRDRGVRFFANLGKQF